MRQNLVRSLSTTSKDLREDAKWKAILDWMDNMQERVDKHILANLPHGSGIDGTWLSHIEYKKVSRFSYRMNKLVCENSIHCMDENGYYDGWIDFSVIIPINGNCLHTDKMEIVAHNWSYHVKKYWPNYVDYVYDTVYYALPRNPLLFTMEVTK